MNTGQSTSDLTEIVALTEIWGLQIHAADIGIAAMFKGGNLHSFGAVGKSNDAHVLVTFYVWAQLRFLSDRAKVASAIYVRAGEKLFYVNFPPMSGLDYRIVWDAVHGVCVQIPKTEFKLIERKEKTS
jgi:hypothetical protein